MILTVDIVKAELLFNRFTGDRHSLIAYIISIGVIDGCDTIVVRQVCGKIAIDVLGGGLISTAMYKYHELIMSALSFNSEYMKTIPYDAIKVISIENFEL